MIPFGRGLYLDNSNNYGIVQTETVFGFVPQNPKSFANDSYNHTEPMEWVLTRGSFERPFFDAETTARSLKIIPKVITKKHGKVSKEKIISSSEKSTKKTAKNTPKKIKRQAKKVNKCIFKIFKKGEGGKKRRRKQGQQKFKMGKKYMMPIILGLLAAKSLLIPIILKFLAFISAKGLAMGFFSTVLASVLSLKNVFDHHHNSRKDDSKTQVEIIQVPSQDSHHYHDENFKRGDYFVPYNLKDIYYTPKGTYKSAPYYPKGGIPYTHRGMAYNPKGVEYVPRDIYFDAKDIPDLGKDKLQGRTEVNEI